MGMPALLKKTKDNNLIYLLPDTLYSTARKKGIFGLLSSLGALIHASVLPKQQHPKPLFES